MLILSEMEACDMADDLLDLPPTPEPPRRVTIQRGAQVPDTVELRVPSAKYYTLRYLLAAFLAEGESRVRNPALSDDTAVLVRAMRALGGQVAWERDGDTGWSARITGCGGRPSVPPGGVIQAGNAGAVLRFLLGVGALLPEVRFGTDHPGSLGRRPNADLLAALESLGIVTESQGSDGLLPITMRGGPPRGGAVNVSGSRSSQYASALLYLAPLLPEGLDLTITDDLRSATLLRATLRTLGEAGITCNASDDLRRLTTTGGQTYRAREYVVPGDAPSAAALAGAALALDTRQTLRSLDLDGEETRAMIAALEAFGARLTLDHAQSALIVERGAQLHGATLDGDAIIDSVPVLVALACLVEGESRFEHVANLRLKESDRIGDLCDEMRSAGADLDPLRDAIIVRGSPQGVAGGATVASHDDHRLAQALAILALRSDRRLTITNADAVAKSYPGFFTDLAALGAQIREEARAD
jgi:3-phosphoshikimate 1-carboxyvinyltransferase